VIGWFNIIIQKDFYRPFIISAYMHADIVMPQGNEEEFIQMCRKLGYNKVYLVYDSEKTDGLKDKIKDIKARYSKGNLKAYAGVKCPEKDIKKFSSFSDIVLCKSGENDRAVLERFRPDVLYDLEYQKRSDFLHNKNSGMNHVMAKIAAKNGVAIGVNLSKLFDSPSHIRTKAIPRIKQNIELCRKSKARFVAFSLASSPYLMRAPGDVVAYLKILGMTAPQARASTELDF
jgi:ribonuclease P/MRP protein subunit RPP1